MPQLLIALLILGLGLYGLRFFAQAPPRTVARIVRYGGGAAVGIVSLLLIVRGRFDLGMAGLGFTGWLTGFFSLPQRGLFGAMFGHLGQPARGQSSVRSATIAMELDHASGAMRGTVTAGPQAGRPLDTFARPECEALYRTCLRDDPEGARLLEAYMDRRFAGWRETGQAQSGTGTNRAGWSDSTVSEEQAYQILGLGKGATRAEIVRAHRALMKKFHPDHGGTTDVAALVNEAKAVLLRQVR